LGCVADAAIDCSGAKRHAAIMVAQNLV